MKGKTKKKLVVQQQIDESTAQVLGLTDTSSQPVPPAAMELFQKKHGPAKLAWYVNTPANGEKRPGNKQQ